MKKIVILFVLVLGIFASCKDEKSGKKDKETVNETMAYASFGDKIMADKALSSAEMLQQFKALKAGDTIDVKFTSKVNKVCSKKGCWMRLALDTDKETMVRFKDYGFFVPLDSQDKEVIVAGKAFIKETSVDELRHYAEDAGKSEEEIAKITEPKREFAFEANGVLMKK